MEILCIVQARMGSERLTGKVMKEVEGTPLIGHTLQRLSRSKYITKVVLATSENKENDVLVDYAESIGFDVFRGDEDNVLKRYKEASDKFKGDIIIRVTGDCPFIDPIIVDSVISTFLINDYDFVKLDVPDAFIRGFDTEVFSRESLELANKIVNEEKHFEGQDIERMFTEHVTYFMYTSQNIFSVYKIVSDSFYKKNYRLCVDTPSDFELIEKIATHFKDMHVCSKEIIKFLDKNKDIAEINKEVKQRM